MGVIFGSIPNSVQGDPRNQIPAGLLYTIGAIVIAVALVTLVGGSCLLYSALAVRKHKRRTFVLVMAPLNCLDYKAPQTLTISTATAGTTIRYTLDGTTPTESNGTVGTWSRSAAQRLSRPSPTRAA